MNEGLSVSQNDVARLAKVSRSTVSRALINHPGIPQETKRRVLRAARQLGYRKNPLVAMLSAQIRSSRLRKVESTLAYLTSIAELRAGEVNPTYYPFFVGAKRRAEELGYGLDPIWRNERSMTSERVTKILSSRGIKGIILAPRPRALGHISLQWDKFAAVSIGHPLPAPKIHCSSAWHSDLMVKALRAIGKHGYHRVGLALFPNTDEYSHHLFSARYCLSQYVISAPQDRVPLFCRPFSKDRPDFARFERWYLRNRPEVIIGAGLASLEWLDKMGVAVPDEVAYVDICLADDCGEYAGVFEQPEVIAATAVDLVVEQLHSNCLGPPKHPKLVLTEGVWVEGPTLPRRVKVAEKK